MGNWNLVPCESVSSNLLDEITDYDTGKVLTTHEGLPSDFLDRVGDARPPQFSVVLHCLRLDRKGFIVDERLPVCFLVSHIACLND